jgi:peptide/nickel transport system substrate-binding protein
VKFHDGSPLTSEDVKFSFDRYRGASAKQIKERVAAVETPGPLQVRFRLKNPWPDFMTFYTAASGAGWIVPKKYVEKVGDDGYKKAPIGAGPYKFVSFAPGVELVMEAFDGYWRKTPSVKRLVFKVISDESTRLAALKRGEIDVVYSIRGELAEELQKSPGLTLKPTVIQSPQWVAMLDQWDPKSPWHDKRLRLAVNHALNRKAINEVSCLGFCPPTGIIVPRVMDFALQTEPPAYDPAKARQLLAEAGYPKGLDAGEFVPIPPFFTAAEVMVNDLAAVGIRTRMRTMERAAFYSAWREKKLQLGQRGQPGGGVHLLQGELRVRRLSRSRRHVPAAGA